MRARGARASRGLRRVDAVVQHLRARLRDGAGQILEGMRRVGELIAHALRAGASRRALATLGLFATLAAAGALGGSACAPAPTSSSALGSAALDGARDEGEEDRAMAGPPEPAPDPRSFQTGPVARHLAALRRDGSAAVAASPHAEDARGYIAAQLEAAGFEVEELRHGDESAPLTSLIAQRLATPSGDVAELAPGDASAQRAAPSNALLFAAPYTLERSAVGAAAHEAGASGAALLLELARALASEPRAYALRFVFVSGDGLAEDGEPSDPIAGSRAVARELAARRWLEGVRAAFFVDRVGACRPRVARDLYSNRSYREAVWRAARELGREDVLAGDGFETPVAGHRAFQEAGVRQIVALVGSADGEAGASERSCSVGPSGDVSEHAGGVASLGAVLLHAARSIEQRLAGIDRFAAAPAAVTALDPSARAAAGGAGADEPVEANAVEQSEIGSVAERTEGSAAAGDAEPSESPDASAGRGAAP